ncbi:helix-turn-helix domain-containing protein [Clostridium swellfunianum]|uniref:helix-turn-helix domain-containing protein n=1 Tax=Clostridium swellfunianum TaxID=1367462 RepID=UPI00202F3FC2|nr:helix-turn-helix transcriptional regulator [Clostridium swellfunianum]MCM0650165.1 helix-turn-helix domain-containing protein [Clostridium swellfunianum]
MKRELHELIEIEEKVKNKLDFIKSSSNSALEDVNKVKALKNSIYEKVSKTFVYNLKRLIKLEATQKDLAKKIGVSEDLLSKYKSGEAFPSIETLIYICEIYGISMEKLVALPLTTIDIENMENSQDVDIKVFEEKYYAYFLVTNIARGGAIHEGVVEIINNSVVFKILANGEVIKCFSGGYSTSDKLIFFNLQGQSNGTACISMIKPNVNKDRYLGGLAMLMLPSDANSKPCVQKLLLSKIPIDREGHYSSLKELLNFNALGVGHVKISQWEDEVAYNFISKLL